LLGGNNIGGNFFMWNERFVSFVIVSTVLVQAGIKRFRFIKVNIVIVSKWFSPWVDFV
jgi:hypothetical protein